MIPLGSICYDILFARGSHCSKPLMDVNTTCTSLVPELGEITNDIGARFRSPLAGADAPIKELALHCCALERALHGSTRAQPPGYRSETQARQAPR
jgi:hypothetical protein